MNPPSRSGAGEDGAFQAPWEDGERVFYRSWREDAEGRRQEFIAVACAGEQPAPGGVDRLAHEYELRDHLDAAWALRPLDLVQEPGRAVLLLEPAPGEPLDRLIAGPMEAGRFLRLALALSAALGRLHERGLIHKDIKPTHILVDAATDQIRLTGFGIASRLPRERHVPGPPEVIAGTLAYMAPEQTGRMNRSIDSRSDLYALGVTFYEMLTGSLPFAASDPMEWVHCHIARQAIAPHERASGIPEALSSLVMKLLAKTAEERYQTAAGVEADLRRCLGEWQAHGRIDPFPVGAQDASNRLLIAEQLYGREREVATLLASVDRVVTQGAPELVLVSGYSGVGKSSVVNELHKVLVPQGGLFAAGKFDQYRRDIPYATLAQAFQTLIRPILAKSEAELGRWRETLLQALDPLGALIVDLVPELKLIVGEQEPVPELAGPDARRRFQSLLRRFIGVFARPEHPLALFLDDLQWLDAATLDLLEDLLTHESVPHLLLIGAYRDNEVDASHPLMRKLGSIKAAGATSIEEITLGALDARHVSQLIADALHCETDRVGDLAQLILQKTDGNPFFINQFLLALTDEGLIAFDSVHSRWTWDLKRIHAKGYTDSVADLMIGKLNRLPVETQKALQQFACLGSSATFDTLQMVYQDTLEDFHRQLWEAVRTNLIFRSETSYRFLHDRVQEAAYSLIPEELRAQAHLRIGRLLANNTPPGRWDESIFEIVNQLTRALHLVTSIKEREQVAALNLAAARRAKVSTALVSALKYLEAGRSLLTEQTWEGNYDLIFSIESLTAECELLTAEMVAAETRLTMLSGRAKSGHDFAAVTRLLLTLYTTLDRSEVAIDLFLDYLRRSGTDWSKHPTRHEVIGEYDRIWSLLGKRQIEDLVGLPLLTDPNVIDMLDVFTEIVHPAMFYDENLSSLAVCRMVNLSLEHGNGDGSCFGYVWFAMFAGPRFNNYKDGFRFGQLGYDLVETRGFTRYQARTYITFSTLMPWARHAANARKLVRRAFDVAYRMGDLTFSAYGWHVLITNYLMVGDHLSVVQEEAEAGLAFTTQQGFGLVAANCGAQLGLVRTLRGLTRSFGRFDDEDYNESESERYLASNPGLALAEFFYWTRKLQGRFFAGDYATAMDASRRAHSLLWPAASQVETGEFRFYGALAHAAAWNSASTVEKQRHFEALIEHYRQLEIWAEHCPANFENRAALVSAEIARMDGRDVDAMRLYEQAIRSSREYGFVQNEAVAYELAARFYDARGFETFADAYLRRARDCYLRWGADGKVRQLDRVYPHLAGPERQHSAAAIGSAIQQLDVASVVKASQALSGEIEAPKLIDRLMTIAIENAGADRGLLILPAGHEYLIQAEARATGNQIEVTMRQEPITGIACPESVVRYVIRTQESVILDDASKLNLFSADDYLRDRRSKSILCLPLIKQQQLVGILLLENSLTSHAFTPARIAVLELLAAQAAISLENTRLYSDLQEREAKVSRLVDSNIIGILIKTLDGHIQEANQAFLQMLGYDQADVESGRLRRTELTPVEWHDRDARAVTEMTTMGTAQPYEKEYFRKDGSRVPVLVGCAAFGERRHGVIAFVVDLSDRKRAEDAERRYHEVHMELAHANRVATLGQLSASIAHEINQPLSGIITNASTGLRMLAADPPNVEGARETARRTIRDGNRAHEVIKRLRALFSKKDPTIETMDLNEAAREVIALSLSEFQRDRVICQAELADDLPLVRCDRVQLQQVILNLLRNALDSMSAVDDRPKRLIVRTAMSEPDQVMLAVQDSGSGVDPAKLERIFDAFYTTKPGGLGMGLSVCRAIVEAHGGRLWATQGTLQGATFQLTLPVSAEDGFVRNRFAVPGSKTS